MSIALLQEKKEIRKASGLIIYYNKLFLTKSKIKSKGGLGWQSQTKRPYFNSSYTLRDTP